MISNSFDFFFIETILLSLINYIYLQLSFLFAVIEKKVKAASTLQHFTFFSQICTMSVVHDKTRDGRENIRRVEVARRISRAWCILRVQPGHLVIKKVKKRQRVQTLCYSQWPRNLVPFFFFKCMYIRMEKCLGVKVKAVGKSESRFRGNRSDNFLLMMIRERENSLFFI